jgi:hypothetical protein
LLLVVPILTVDLDYRYVLGAEELIIPAGALGAAVLAAQARAPLAVRTRQPLAGIVAAVVLAGSLAGNLVAEQAYAGGSFTPVADGVVGTPLRLHNRAVVSVGPPAAGSTCDSRAGSTGAPTGPWRLTFDVHARWRSGPSLLMTTDDFYLRSASGVVLPSVHVSHRFGLLVPVMIGPAVREAAGRIEFTVTEPPSKLIYIDPLGAGSLQWTLSRSAVEPTPALAGC